MTDNKVDIVGIILKKTKEAVLFQFEGREHWFLLTDADEFEWLEEDEEATVTLPLPSED